MVNSIFYSVHINVMETLGLLLKCLMSWPYIHVNVFNDKFETSPFLCYLHR